MSKTATTLLHLFLLFAAANSSHNLPGGHHRHTLDEACRATLHPSLCVQSLSPLTHPRSARRSPRWWAHAALSLAASEVRRAGTGLPQLHRLVRGRHAAAALADCSECLSDAEDMLRGSLTELSRLEPSTFERQMEDVKTWVSAALTDEETCVDGFVEEGGDDVDEGKGLAAEIRRRVTNTTYYTSNALALVNCFASIRGM
ncbi:hypothetical protein HPP92_006920 [Vanilla planifolia]|uniref:Pectinesterase inhibitor domain-containing protein n=1 Tax=Vanilla planifolia TaxID=51239 RepID=A0A835V5E3_VANPL|nr:hypothetical protein HPP92_006920 [Vanilla planifolia]